MHQRKICLVERTGGTIKMNEIIMNVMIQIGAYTTVILLSVFFMNWVTQGFLFPSIRCKLGAGKYTLVFVKSISGDYYKAGKISEGMLIFKDNLKNVKRIPIEGVEYISYIGGTKAVIIDEVKNAVLKADFSTSTGFDAVKYENLYVRALTSPNLQDANLKLILIASVIAAGGVIVCAWFIWLQGEQITQILELLKNLGAGL